MLQFLHTRKILKCLEKGKFRRLMSPLQAKAFMLYADRQASIPHNRKIILRLTMNGHDENDRWYLWAFYKITNTEPAMMVLDSIYIPSGRDDRLTAPEEIDDTEYFRA